jgi:serine O-acetyltransferase
MKWQKTSHFLYTHHIPILPRLMHITARILFSCSIPPKVVLADGVRLAHNGLGVVIHEDAVIGKGTVLLHNVTIGGKNGQGPPKIGNYCFIGAGACILGEISIGDDVMVGANAVVTKSVPAGTIVAGVPAKRIGEVPAECIGIPKH